MMEPESPDGHPPLSETYKLLAALALSNERMCGRMEAVEKSVDGLTAELAPLAGGARSRASVVRATAGIIQKATITQAVALVVMLGAAVLAVPVGVAATRYAWTDPPGFIAAMTTLFDALPLIEVGHPEKPPESTQEPR